jgi:hypothetical protein
MFTDNQLKELDDIYSSLSLDDLDTPDLPKIKFPDWLPSIVQSKVKERLQSVEEKKNDPNRLYIAVYFFDLYPYLARNFQTLQPLFTDVRMRPIWEKLTKISEEKTEQFIIRLFKFKNDYDGGMHLVEKHRDEIRSCQRMLDATQKLLDAMEEYHYHYYGHMLQDNFHDIMATLEVFKKDTAISLEEFKQTPQDASKLFSNHWPMTRKSNMENALAIFFIKKIFLFFQKEFQTPMYNFIAEIISIIFQLDLEENQIIKHCMTVIPLLSEDSVL